MPKVKSYSASWLAMDSPGYRLFQPSPESLRSRALSPSYPSKKKPIAGPRRTIARRGTEVFVAVGKEIRWGDLVYLKEQHAGRQTRGRSSQTPRIKREDSSMSFAEEDLEFMGGMRVRTFGSF